MHSFKKMNCQLITKLFMFLLLFCLFLSEAYAEDYNAYLGLNTSDNERTRVFRRPWYSSQYGLNDSLSPEDYTYRSDNLLERPLSDNEPHIYPVTEINDAIITESGTYSVSIKGLNLKDKPGISLNELFISTDFEEHEAYFTYMKVLFDGKTVLEVSEDDLEIKEGEQGLWLYEGITNSYSAEGINYNISYAIIGGPYNFDYDIPFPTFEYDFPSDIEVIFTVQLIENAVPSPTPIYDIGKLDNNTDTDATPTPDILESTDPGMMWEEPVIDTTLPSRTPDAADDTFPLGILVGICISVVLILILTVIFAKKKK